MTTLKAYIFASVLLLFATTTSTAGVIGDTNGDGVVDIAEALYALQVSSGLHPNLPDSCVITGHGDWATGTEYNICDVVKHEGTFYICSRAHTSEAGNVPPDVAYWTILGLKGDTGAEGPQGPPGEPGTLSDVNLAQFIIGVWDTAIYNNGGNGETGRIIFYEDNSFKVEGVFRIIIGYWEGGGTGTYQVFDGIIQVKLDGINPMNGSEYDSGYLFPLMVRDNYISLTRSMNQAVLKRVLDN